METLTERFYQLVAPSMPNEWDVEDALASLAHVKQADREIIFGQVPVVWSVSHALCFTYLSYSHDIVTHVSPDNMSVWISSLLDRYEGGGLVSARSFIDEVKTFTPLLEGYGGLTLEEAAKTLQPYVTGLHGRELPLVSSRKVYTDTASIFLPREVQLRSSRDEAFLLYKFIVSYQWASIALGSLAVRGAIKEYDDHPLAVFFQKFDHPERIKALYLFFESVRIEHFLHKELPGLMSRVTPLLPAFYEGDEQGTTLLGQIQRDLFLNKGTVPKFLMQQSIDGLSDMIRKCRSREGCQEMSLRLSAKAYEQIPPAMAQQYLFRPPVFQGELDLPKVVKVLAHRKAVRRQRFIEALTKIFLDEDTMPVKEKNTSAEKKGRDAGANEADQAMVIFQQDGNQEDDEQNRPVTHIVIDNEQMALSEELSALTREILDDIGYLPAEYVSSAVGEAGGMSKAPSIGPEDSHKQRQDRIVYDEWDYRRKGYRKNWCVLTEKEIPPVASTFIRDTLEKYQGHIHRLRSQFEQLQTVERFVRRQRAGDDIDFDALVEAIADRRAGYPPSDKVFIRLLRDERDIAACFLVDMSNSTEGWVGRAIKEALVLICEAMEMLDDRYAIYGFSGMRRLRCEMYQVKSINEAYTEQVRQRIAAIDPREYTRMAPAIRHSTVMLSRIEARLKLMVMLTDGKPEDYDDYKGEYAIEDTRHALLEAKAVGIHPFCITIDRHAHEYMEHMCGANNYIFVNDIKRLPALMPEMYRCLTS